MCSDACETGGGAVYARGITPEGAELVRQELGAEISEGHDAVAVIEIRSLGVARLALARLKVEVAAHFVVSEVELQRRWPALTGPKPSFAMTCHSLRLPC